MKLPSLSELDLDNDLEENKDENTSKKPVKKKKQTSAGNKKQASISQKKPSGVSLPKMDVPNKNRQEIKKEEVKKERPKVPKSQYDAEGNPILTIPDLDDVDLTSEIDRFFGKEDD